MEHKMPIDKKLLEILCCPKTKVDLETLSETELIQLNKKIAQNELKYMDGTIVKEALTEGLITIDKKIVYRIDDGIPVMLLDKGIPV